MILHGEYRTADVLEALNGAVVQVDIAHAGDLRVNRLAYNGIAVVLRGDVGAVCVDVLYRMVDTAVTVLQLGGLCVDSQCQQLVTEADAEDRPLDSITPSYLPTTSSGLVYAGTTVTSQPRLHSSRSMLYFTP